MVVMQLGVQNFEQTGKAGTPANAESAAKDNIKSGFESFLQGGNSKNPEKTNDSSNTGSIVKDNVKEMFNKNKNADKKVDESQFICQGNIVNTSYAVKELEVSITEEVKEVLKCTEADVVSSLADLNMTKSDLLKEANVIKLVMNINQIEDSSELLVNQEAYGQFTEINTLISDLVKEFSDDYGVPAENVGDLLREFDMAMQVEMQQEVPNTVDTVFESEPVIYEPNVQKQNKTVTEETKMTDITDDNTTEQKINNAAQLTGGEEQDNKKVYSKPENEQMPGKATQKEISTKVEGSQVIREDEDTGIKNVDTVIADDKTDTDILVLHGSTQDIKYSDSNETHIENPGAGNVSPKNEEQIYMKDENNENVIVQTTEYVEDSAIVNANAGAEVSTDAENLYTGKNRRDNQTEQPETEHKSGKNTDDVIVKNYPESFRKTEVKTNDDIVKDYNDGRAKEIINKLQKDVEIKTTDNLNTANRIKIPNESGMKQQKSNEPLFDFKNVTANLTEHVDAALTGRPVTENERLSFTSRIMEQVMDNVKVMSADGLSSMEMQLEPENLGKLNIHVVAKNGVVTAQITAQNEAVKNALESQVAVLKENLNKQEIKVEDVEVTVASHAFEQGMGNNDSSGNQRQNKRRFNSSQESTVLNENELKSIKEELLEEAMREKQGSTVSYTA